MGDRKNINDSIYTFLKSVDKIESSLRLIKKPLRISLQDICNINGIETVSVGHVEAGVIKPNMIVIVFCQGFSSEVKSIKKL